MRVEPEPHRFGLCIENPNFPHSPPSGFCPPRRYLIILASLLAVSLTGCSKKDVTAAAAPPEVEVVGVIQENVPLYTECISTLDGYINAEIRPQVSGYLLKQNYQEGTVVRKGQTLFEIDPRPFEAALEQTKGQLAQAEAQLGKTKLDGAGDPPMAQQSAIPQAQLDNDIQANESARGVVPHGK